MAHVTAAADRIATLEKTMLTCFVSNAHARRFYERLGFEVDDSSPRARRLRGEKVIEPEYVILSRRTTREEKDGEAATDDKGDGHQDKRAKRTAAAETT